MIAATGNPAVKAGFEPAVPGFTQVEPGDFDALAAAVDDETAGDHHRADPGRGRRQPLSRRLRSRSVRKLCDERELTLIFDEVWTGCGRTGRWFGHQHFTDADGKVDRAGHHDPRQGRRRRAAGGRDVRQAATSPSCSSPASTARRSAATRSAWRSSRTIFDVIEREKLLEHAAVLGEHAIARLRNETAIATKVADVRGRGLFLGIELKSRRRSSSRRAWRRASSINLTAKKVIRLAPPINISRAAVGRGARPASSTSIADLRRAVRHDSA